MKSASGLGWLTAGVLALGLNGMYLDSAGQLAQPVIDRISERSTLISERVADQATQFLTRVGLVSAPDRETLACRKAYSVARMQAQLTQAESDFNFQQAFDTRQLNRMQAQQVRRAARLAVAQSRLAGQAFKFRFASQQFLPVRVEVPSICPRVRVTAPRIRVAVPAVRVDPQVITVATGDSDPI